MVSVIEVFFMVHSGSKLYTLSRESTKGIRKGAKSHQIDPLQTLHKQHGYGGMGEE